MLYVSTACLKGDTISRIIQQIAECGLTNIELSGGTKYYGKIEDDLKILKYEYCLNYACHAYFPPPKIPFVINLAACNDEIYQQSINHYVRCIEMLKRIRCNVLSVHAGFLIEIGAGEIGKKLSDKIIYDEKEAYDRFYTAYQYISKLCAENAIDLYLENNVLNIENYKEFGYHNYMMMTDYESIMKMKGKLDFNLLLDLGHLYVSSKTLGLNYTNQCRLLQRHVKWIHVSENNGVLDEHKPLKANSEILKGFSGSYDSSTNITLETKGSMKEILASIKLMDNLLI